MGVYTCFKRLMLGLEVKTLEAETNAKAAKLGGQLKNINRGRKEVSR